MRELIIIMNLYYKSIWYNNNNYNNISLTIDDFPSETMNNYELLDLWMSKIDTEGFSILNIDEDSTKENKQHGVDVCKKYGITYMDREERGMLHNVVSACKYFENQNIEWIVFITHDCYPTTPNFFTKFI